MRGASPAAARSLAVDEAAFGWFELLADVAGAEASVGAAVAARARRGEDVPYIESEALGLALRRLAGADGDGNPLLAIHAWASARTPRVLTRVYAEGGAAPSGDDATLLSLCALLTSPDGAGDASAPALVPAPDRDPSSGALSSPLFWDGLHAPILSRLDLYYSRAVPTAAALDAAKGAGPLVELRAGSGYWAALLAARGADIVAYEASPRRTATHAPVAAGGVDVLARHRDRALLVVCAVYGDDDERGDGGEPWDAAALRAYAGDTLVHVGAFSSPRCPSPNTSSAFQALCRAEWTVSRTIAPIVDLASRHLPDTLTVWTRRA